VSAFRLVMEGGPQDGRVIKYDGAHPPLIWRFAALPAIPACAFGPGEDGAPVMEADDYQRTAWTNADRDLWLYTYLGRR
jgi:hypothetical protein